MEYVTDRAVRSLKTKFLSSIPSQILEFDLEIVCENEINLFQANMIKSWLFGQITPKKLFIINNELSNVYFNCLLNNPEDIQINGNNGWKFTVVCDAGGAWELPKTTAFTPGPVDSAITINNLSGNNDYTYPTVKFTLSENETDFSIKNTSDNNRTFLFSGLSGGETISIDGDTKIITSSISVNRLGNFNKNFLRLKRGANHLVCNGSISSLEITTQNFRRLGG